MSSTDGDWPTLKERVTRQNMLLEVSRERPAVLPADRATLLIEQMVVDQGNRVV